MSTPQPLSTDQSLPTHCSTAVTLQHQHINSTNESLFNHCLCVNELSTCQHPCPHVSHTVHTSVPIRMSTTVHTYVSVETSTTGQQSVAIHMLGTVYTSTTVLNVNCCACVKHAYIHAYIRQPLSTLQKLSTRLPSPLSVTDPTPV